MKILTLEDELEINDFYEVLFQEFEHEVFSTATSQEATQITKDQPIDLAIIDFRLSLSGSEKNGLETITELKNIRPEMKIIMVSANYPDNLEENYKQYGIDMLVRKPFHIDEMLMNIKQLTEENGGN